MGATEEIKGLNVFADWRIIASRSQNMAWQGSPAAALSGDVFPHGRGEYMARVAPSAILRSVLVPHDPAPVQLVSVDSEKLLERKWLISSKETETVALFWSPVCGQNKTALIAATGG